MADKCHVCLLVLIILSPFLTGTSREEETHVFISSGENVRLSCNNALPDCKATTWIYNKDGNKPTVELITLGIKKNDTKKHERLSLESDCSLNIKKVTKEDYGFYSCQQYVSGELQETDTFVYLHILIVSVSSSSSQTEIRPGLSVTLSCQLNSYYRFSCDYLVQFEEIQLIWVNQANVSEMTDSRYQILFLPSYCTSTLTTTLLNEDHNREWRCQLIQRNEPKTSASYTVKYSETFSPSVIVIVVVVAVLAVLTPVVILWVIRKRKIDNRRETNGSVVRKDDVTYTEVVTHSRNQPKKSKVPCDDKVTYSSIRGGEAEPQDNCSQLYALVKKKRQK